jgi:methyl-accepting chemotaxis protein
MKLGSKLLLPSLVTAAVALGCGAVNSLMMSREAAAVAEHYTADIAHLRSIAGAQDQLGRTHASVYRSFTLIGSMDEPKIKAFRADVARQVQEMETTVAQVGNTLADKPELGKDAVELKGHLGEYAKQADQAIDLASVDPKDRKSTRLNSSHRLTSRMPSSA